eukprot:TRINITY_DN11601_c0_g1_i1.p1 TRINITY_DN11601_c0_g1~~TRINITY_DN11601_c0_g1_i1.p1  ORF type:complete len:180 (-),score=35.11 TRINITY_DN11601_c0_g1_i1:109-567(-)
MPSPPRVHAAATAVGCNFLDRADFVGSVPTASLLDGSDTDDSDCAAAGAGRLILHADSFWTDHACKLRSSQKGAAEQAPENAPAKPYLKHVDSMKLSRVSQRSATEPQVQTLPTPTLKHVNSLDVEQRASRRSSKSSTASSIFEGLKSLVQF